MSSHWDQPGRLDQLKELHKLGLSCKQIALRLGGGISRSAVIGKLHRLGLAHTRPRMRADGRSEAHLPRAPRTRNPSRPTQHLRMLERSFGEYEAACSAKERPLPPGVKPVTIITLDHRHCRWPIGDPAMPDFRFCGDTKVPGLSYCEAHHWRAHDRPVRVARSPLEAPGEPVHKDAPASALSRVVEPA